MYKKIKVAIKNKLLQNKLKKANNLFKLDISALNSKRVLIIDDIIPEFNKDSGSRRLTEIIKLLLKNKVSVFLIGDLKEYKYKSSYIEKFKNLGVIVYEPSIDEKGNLITKEGFIKKIAPLLNVAWLHRPGIFDKYYKVIKESNENVELIFDMVDFHYLRLLREWELDKTNSNLKIQAQKHLAIEINNCKQADKIIVISDLDKASLKEHYPTTDKMISIGNVHQFQEINEDFKSFENRSNLLFIGGFKHTPNVDAVLFLKNEIMPIVWSSNPNICVNVVGSYPTDKVITLNSDKFKVIGFVEDVSGYLKNSKLFVAPLRYGAGIKGKIGQSFEYSLPVVTTSIGAEGFDFGEFKDQMIANNAQNIANKIIELYSNGTLWNAVSATSSAIIQPFSKEENERKICEILGV